MRNESLQIGIVLGWKSYIMLLEKNVTGETYIQDVLEPVTIPFGLQHVEPNLIFQHINVQPKLRWLSG